MSRYRFIHAEKATFEIVRMCELLTVSRSGYYKWVDRQAAGPSARARRHEDLLVKIRQFHADSDGVNGAPRITADLREELGDTHLSIDALVRRIEQGGIDEVVLAMNATLEGQTTAHYLAERIERFPVRVTQLAHGLPVGGELDYLDEGTLAQALRARRPVS